MDESVLEIVDRMLRFRRSREGSTERFQRLRHDEHLLPRFQMQFEAILESYDKFTPITYKTHSVRDQGVDIVIRSDDKDYGAPSLIGFQIKSTSDLLEKDYMQKLKAQYFESSTIRGLEFYYIVLCVDEKQHKRRLNIIEGEFKNAPRTKIIEPGFADTFLALKQERIDAYIKHTLAGGDVVMKKALEIVDFPSRMTGAVVAYLAVQQYVVSLRPIEIATVMASPTLRAFHRSLVQSAEMAYEDLQHESNEDAIVFEEMAEVLHDFDQEIVENIEAIRDDIITVDGDVITVRFDQVTPLVALAMEAVVRYEYEPNAITAYLLDLLDLNDYIQPAIESVVESKHESLEDSANLPPADFVAADITTKFRGNVPTVLCDCDRPRD